MDKTNNDDGAAKAAWERIMTGQTNVEVTQEDRDAAEPLFRTDWARDEARQGKRDADERIQAFARHRQQAIAQHEGTHTDRLARRMGAKFVERDGEPFSRPTDPSEEEWQEWVPQAQHEGDEKPVGAEYRRELWEPLPQATPATPIQMGEGDLVKRLQAVVPYQGKSNVAFLCHEAAEAIYHLSTLQSERDAAVAEVGRLREELAAIDAEMQFPNSLESGFVHGRMTFADMQRRIEITQSICRAALNEQPDGEEV